MRKKFLLTILISSLFLNGCNKSETVSRESYDSMYDHLVECWNQSLKGMHFDNVFYGDSRVIGGDFAGYFAEKSVLNLGVGGDRVNNLIRRFKLIETTTPKRVFLSIGGNDAFSDEYSLENFKIQYDSLLDKFKDFNCDVVVHNVVGITISNSSLTQQRVNECNTKISEINKYIKEACLKMNFTFIDIASKMNKEETNEMNPDYSSDGVHFNSLGYKIWTGELSSLII